MTALRGYETIPTKIAQTTPLNSKPAPGKTVVWLNCGSPGCHTIWQTIQQAVAIVGWHAKEISFNLADPSTLITAMNTALQMHPVAVGFSGPPLQLYQSEIPAFQKAGVALIPISSGSAPISKAIPAIIYGPNDNANGGNILGSWFVATSSGSGKALLVNYPDIGSFAPTVTAFKKTIASCSGCSYTELDLTVAQLQSGSTAAVVSALQKDHSIKYVVDTYGEALTGFQAAISAAGLSGIKVAGINPSEDQMAGLLNGGFQAWLSNVSFGIGWTFTDIALRFSEGIPVPAEDGGIPVVLFTKNNIGTPSITSSNLPTDAASQYGNLWKS
jgi:ribose transport system substrate-binding protein